MRDHIVPKLVLLAFPTFHTIRLLPSHAAIETRLNHSPAPHKVSGRYQRHPNFKFLSFAVDAFPVCCRANKRFPTLSRYFNGRPNVLRLARSGFVSGASDGLIHWLGCGGPLSKSRRTPIASHDLYLAMREKPRVPKIPVTPETPIYEYTPPRFVGSTIGERRMSVQRGVPWQRGFCITDRQLFY